MGQRVVHNTHRWSHTNHQCKGCGLSMNDKKAEQPCSDPYKPAARLPKERRKA